MGGTGTSQWQRQDVWSPLLPLGVSSQLIVSQGSPQVKPPSHRDQSPPERGPEPGRQTPRFLPCGEHGTLGPAPACSPQLLVLETPAIQTAACESVCPSPAHRALREP